MKPIANQMNNGHKKNILKAYIHFKEDDCAIYKKEEQIM